MVPCWCWPWIYATTNTPLLYFHTTNTEKSTYESLGMGFSCYCDENSSSVSCQRFTELGNYQQLSLIYDDATRSYSFAAECICQTTSCNAMAEITSCYGYTPETSTTNMDCGTPSSTSCSMCTSLNGLEGFVALETPELGCSQTLMLLDESFLLSDSGGGAGGIADSNSGAISIKFWCFVAAASFMGSLIV